MQGLVLVLEPSGYLPELEQDFRRVELEPFRILVVADMLVLVQDCKQEAEQQEEDYRQDIEHRSNSIVP